MEVPESSSRRMTVHFYSLDAIRGLAAIAVVLHHWQHFFMEGPFDASRQPFYKFFRPFYTDGWRAVDLFFCLSGFIFFWLYQERISSRRISAREFWMLRLSRLYPLHMLTLLVVLALQQIMLKLNGSYFVYSNNDYYHFALQTVFASNWGLDKGFSFNGPIWSVSVEIFCYAIFFSICFLRLTRWWWLVAFIYAGYSLQSTDLVNIGRGIFSFFSGCLTFRIFRLISDRRPPAFALWFLSAVVISLWFFIPAVCNHNLLYKLYNSQSWKGYLTING